MRLKRLELFGFKSFADRTVMEFGRNSLTGIVGPNGCGKSNVVDAVRWVLGETRPTSLRGSGMTDVIFKGSVSRPGMSMAEVTIVLDNEGELEDRGAEVSVSRRLFKTGEGEYLIDGEKVRRKDVRDMLFDTGLGSRGYSVLEQGRIDAVLSANPQQRRAIFEEAAGISRYRQRRHEADLRLGRVDQDTTRLEDVMGELRTRVRSLKIQAGKAERYVEAKGAWTEGRSRFFKHRLYEHECQLNEVKPELEQLEASLEEMREERVGAEEEFGKRENERALTVAELDRMSTEAGRVAGDIRALEERKNQLTLRVSSWRESAVEEEARTEELQELLSVEGDKVAEFAAQRAKLDAELKTAEQEAGGLSGQLRELERNYREMRKQAQEQNDVVLHKLHERTAAQNRSRHLEESVPPTEERLERVSERLESARQSVDEVRAEADAAETAATEARAALVDAEERRAICASELSEADNAWESARQSKGELELERARSTSRIESLLDRDREMEDVGAGTRRVLEAAEQRSAGQDDSCPFELTDLRGIVADHLRADTESARALDAALGERAHFLVASDDTTAASIATWLDAGEEGLAGIVVPASFGSQAPSLPIFKTGPRPHPVYSACFGAELATSGRILGRLIDRVQCQRDTRDLAASLVGDVLVVQDLRTAFEAVARAPRWRYVTLEGELVDAGGMICGRRSLTSGAVGRRASAAELEVAVDGIAERIEELEIELASQDERRDRFRTALEALRMEVEESGAIAGKAEGGLRHSGARLADMEASFTVLEQERARVTDELSRLATDLVQARENEVVSEASFQEENGRLEQMEQGRHRIEQQREELARNESRAQVERTRISGEVDGVVHQLRDCERRVQETSVEIERAGSRREQLLTNVEQGAQEGEVVDAEAQRLETEFEEVQVHLDELRATEKQGRERIETARSEAEEMLQRIDQSNQRLSSQRLAEQRLELASGELLTRAEEELELSRGDLSDGFEPEEDLMRDGALNELERNVSGLKAQLDKLGPVNIEAVTELEEVGGRLEFLETQSGDLAKARQTLMETIARIDEESERLFLETFHTVRANFQRIFRKLFGGGKADVKLEDESNILESGVEIVARPPGRELLSINLLSGGQRTMTALALLFAVFEAKPSPFCVLDEVDAALDDANVDRFLGMLDDFRATSQFLVVTHNKGTMAASEALYGVTMEIKGVSRFVTVELDEVDEFVPGTAGTLKPTSNGKPKEEVASNGHAQVAEAPEVSDDSVDTESGEPMVELVPAVAQADVPETETVSD
ncbi:MAG: chromosome segregation protein [Planctomycetota bacterium]|jgi:chromosome segregation protein